MINPRLNRRLPDSFSMAHAGLRRIPPFVRGYMQGGIGEEVALSRNRQDLDGVQLLPQYLTEDVIPDTHVTIGGAPWSLPFAAAPLGIGGLIWPGAETAIARATLAAGAGYMLSTFATTPVEEMAPIIAGHAGRAAFQLYSPRDPGIEADLIARARAAGFGTLVITVDIPGPTRRRRDIQSGLGFPPHFGLRTVLEAALHPRWSLGHVLRGVPRMGNLAPYFPARGGVQAAARFLSEQMDGHISPARLARLRAAWDGKLIVKGILDPADARIARDLGADGVVVSNHGGRQLDAAPSAVAALPAVRAALGDDALILADGGVRSGLDIVRMAALGADGVLLGRPFLHAAAAAGPAGPAHLVAVLEQELRCTMLQIGCRTLQQVRQRGVWAGTPRPLA